MLLTITKRQLHISSFTGERREKKKKKVKDKAGKTGLGGLDSGKIFINSVKKEGAKSSFLTSSQASEYIMPNPQQPSSIKFNELYKGVTDSTW